MDNRTDATVVSPADLLRRAAEILSRRFGDSFPEEAPDVAAWFAAYDASKQSSAAAPTFDEARMAVAAGEVLTRHDDKSLKAAAFRIIGAICDEHDDCSQDILQLARHALSTLAPSATIAPNESPLAWVVFVHADPQGYDYRIFTDEHEADSVAGEDERNGEAVPLYRASAFLSAASTKSDHG